jgi:hypothetical protein
MRQLVFSGCLFYFHLPSKGKERRRARSFVPPTGGRGMKLPYDVIFDENPRLIRNADNLREFRTGLEDLHSGEALSIENLRHVLKEYSDVFMMHPSHPAIFADPRVINDVQDALVLSEYDYLPNEKNFSKILHWLWQNERPFTLESAQRAITELGNEIERI